METPPFYWVGKRLPTFLWKKYEGWIIRTESKWNKPKDTKSKSGIIVQNGKEPRNPPRPPRAQSAPPPPPPPRGKNPGKSTTYHSKPPKATQAGHAIMNEKGRAMMRRGNPLVNEEELELMMDYYARLTTKGDIRTWKELRQRDLRLNE